ncbi:MAG: copper chaperone PCu(A)C [Gammaproteobacteria bacterium]
MMIRPACRFGLVLVLGWFLWTQEIHAENDVRISNAWINEAPPGMKMMGGYLDISNGSGTDVVLTGVTSPCFEKIEFHISEIKNGVSTMRRQESITIPAGTEFSFSPGRYHLMLMNNTQPLSAGDKVPLSFSFAAGEPAQIEAEIRRGDPASHRHH